MNLQVPVSLLDNMEVSQFKLSTQITRACGAWRRSQVRGSCKICCLGSPRRSSARRALRRPMIAQHRRGARAAYAESLWCGYSPLLPLIEFASRNAQGQVF